MITIYNAKETEFSTLGLGVLQPTECTVEEIENGMFTLSMQVPIEDDMKWARIQPGCIIKAPTPVRESPLVQTSGTTSQTTTRSIYKVVTATGERLRMRAKPSLDAKILGSYKPGTKVIRQGVSGDWAEVILVDGGESGWMWDDNLEFVENITDTVISGGPGVVVQPKQTREQLFRVVSAETNAAGRVLIVRANHIFYDLAGNIVGGEYEAKDTPANVVVSEILSRALNNHDFNIYCSADAPVSCDFTGMNIVNALLDPYEGIVVQADAVLIRDNWDVYIVPRQSRDRGFQIRHGKNMIGAVMTIDRTDVITRIVPVGVNEDGERLYLDGQIYIDSPHIDEYPTIYAAEKDYDVSVGDDENDFESESAARAELRRLVQEDFDSGCDMPIVNLDVQFVALENTAEYAEYASLYSVHMGDLVQVIAPFALINAKLRVTGYVFDCLKKRYSDVTLGDISEMGGTIYGTDIATGSISGNRLVNGSVNGNVLVSASIPYAKIGTAAVKQLSAEALQAVSAHIEKLAAEEITTDELYAALAVIAEAQITAANIEKANIDWADIDTLNASIADISLAKIQTADIDYAKIKDLTTDTAIITEGVGGQLYIARLAVTEANMVQLTVGALMLKAEDGSFVRLVADGSGGVKTEKVEVEGGNIADSTISGNNLIENTITARELNVAKIFADQALIGAIKAANIDVANLFAAQATINQLDSWVISANTIKALQDALDLWASEKINIAVGEIDTSTAQNVQNSSVTITPQMVRILTSLFSVQNEATGMTLDENGLSAEHVSAPNLQEKYTGPSSVTIGTGGDYGSMTSFASEISGKYIAEGINVTVVSDLTGEATFRHVSGAEISIIGGGYSMLAPLNVENCTSRISISNMTFSYSGGVYSKYIGSRVYLLNCLFNISSTARSGRAIDLDQGALLYASNSQFYNTLGRLISINELSRCILEWCAGAPSTGSSAFQVLTGSDLRSLGSYPSGSVTTDASATYTLNGTADSGTAQGTASSLTTQEFTCTNSDTCRGSSNWDGSGYIWQGYTTSGIHRGYMWFDGLAAAISGKTIKSATLKLKRVKGIGREATAVLKAYYSLKTTNSGTQSVQTGYGGELGGIRMGEEKVLDLPVEILTRMQTYGYGGICLYTAETSNASGKNYSSNYCKLYGANSDYAPVLTVTYQ